MWNLILKLHVSLRSYEVYRDLSSSKSIGITSFGGKVGGGGSAALLASAYPSRRSEEILLGIFPPAGHHPNQIGSGLRVSVSFQKIPRVVGRIGSGVRVSVSFQIFSRGNLRDNISGGELVQIP